MSKSVKGKKAQTVLGPVEAENLGLTLPHEHLFVDIRCFFIKPDDPIGRDLSHQKVSLENLWWIKRNIFHNIDNMILDEHETALNEVKYFKQAGGGTIVDVTSTGIALEGSAQGLANISQATGVNIIMGTGYYIGGTLRPEMGIEHRSEEDIAREFIDAIRNGVGDSGIKAGIIGEIGCTWPLEKTEIKVLRAAGMAQRETGAPISIHPGAHEDFAFEAVRILKEVGTDLSQVCFGHMTRAFSPESFKQRSQLAGQGCCLEFDWFGRGGIPRVSLVSEKLLVDDVTRIQQIKALIDDGFLSQIIISHDVCFKVMLQKFGGSGFSYIPTVSVGQMQDMGLSLDQVDTIVIDNPARILGFL